MRGLQHLHSSVFKSYIHICVRSILHVKHSLLKAIKYHDTSEHTKLEIWIEKRLQEDYVAVVIQWVVEVIKVTESGAGEALLSRPADVVHDITHLASDAADETTYPAYNHDIEI